MIVMLAERGNRVRERERERDKHILTTQAWKDGRGRDFRARFTFRSTVPSSSRPRPFVRSGGEGRKEGRKGRSFVRCAAYLRRQPASVAASVPPLLRPTASLHIGICRLLSPSLPLRLLFGLGQNVRVYSQVGMAASLARRVGRYAL